MSLDLNLRANFCFQQNSDKLRQASSMASKLYGKQALWQASSTANKLYGKQALRQASSMASKLYGKQARAYIELKLYKSETLERETNISGSPMNVDINSLIVR
jgi:hypothetical protein